MYREILQEKKGEHKDTTVWPCMGDNMIPLTTSKMKIFNNWPLVRPRSMLKDQPLDGSQGSEQGKGGCRYKKVMCGRAERNERGLVISWPIQVEMSMNDDISK